MGNGEWRIVKPRLPTRRLKPSLAWQDLKTDGQRGSVKNLAAVILAAGQSKRMGQPKMVLPWGETTVLGRMIEVYGTALKADRATAIIVVTGGAREAVEAEAARWAGKFAVRCVHNPEFEVSGMLESLQCGLAELKAGVEAALVGPGDQPQLSLSAARGVVAAFERSGARIIVPSHALRRGHPWLVRRELWAELLELRAPQTLRDFLKTHAEEILYVETDQTILKDLDTPEDYQREKP
jgi:molybdenum cofactor cytidylyltransferase